MLNRLIVLLLTLYVIMCYIVSGSQSMLDKLN